MITPDCSPAAISIPLTADQQRSAIVIVVDDRAYVPAGGIRQLRRYDRTTTGGYIAAAQAKNGSWGYLNERAEWIVTPTLNDARSFGETGLARVQRDGLWGYIDTSGKVVIPPQFEKARAFSAGLAAVQVATDTWRFIDTTGAFASEEAFFRLGDFSAAGLAPAVKSLKDGGAGYIDRNGQWAIPPKFKSDLAFTAAGVAPASLDEKKYGLIDTRGNWVLKPAYPNIREFNDDGLAFFDEENSWDNGHGFLNAKGEVVVKGNRELSPRMVLGLAAAETSGQSYITREGKLLDAPRMSWSGGFHECGYTIARTVDFLWSETRRRHEPRIAQWGLLRADGSFVAAPDEALEPLTDAEGWIPTPRTDTPLAPFLTKDGQIIFLNRDGGIDYHVRYENHRALLLNARGKTLWQSEADDDFQRPAPFFQRPVEAWLDQLDATEHVAAFAESMLAEAEAQLHRFAAGEAMTDKDPSDEENESDDEDDPESRAEQSVVIRRRLVRAYAGEEHNGYYPFLSAIHSKTVKAAEAILLKALKDRFGEPDPDPEYAPRNRYSTISKAWPFKLKRAVAGDTGTLKEASELWLCFNEQSDAGDGDEWHELWLMCAPSVDALRTAIRSRRSGASGTQDEPTIATSRPPEPAAKVPMPHTRDEWLAAVRHDKYAVSHVPAGLMDDTIADAAVEAHSDALEYLPAQWQTPARLEALVRKGASTASNIPIQCMTAAGLALARTLYARDADWQWRDERNSNIPTRWEKNSLYDVWGGLLTEEHCILAMKGGESLQYVPNWLRTERVEQAALTADIYNISYIAQDKITPQLAARAVRHDYGRLIEVIPPALLTPELCLISARTNGLSLEHIPEAMRTADVCMAALQDDSRAYPFVPSALREEVCSLLIEADLADARESGEARKTSHWHRYRAWARLWDNNYEGAIADATLALERARYPQNAHYILACAHHALGHRREAALEASSVLSLEDPYKAEFNAEEDTRWLKKLAQGQSEKIDESKLIEQLRTRPRTLADVPREIITEEMVKVALEADPSTIEFVPKRLMTPEHYIIALKERSKTFTNIPSCMLSEAACIEYVRDSGRYLREVPEKWRTVAVCAHALKDSADALEYVPKPIRQAAQDEASRLPAQSDE